MTGCLFLSCFGFCLGQNTARYDEPEQGFYDAVRLYQNAKYGAAKRAFGVVRRKVDPACDVYFASEIMYYRAMCDVLLFHKNGAMALRDFVETYPNSNRVNTAYLQLANFEYDYKRYQSAYEYYKMVDPVEADLRGEEADRYYFRSGYSAFVQKKYAEAKLAFLPLKDRENHVLLCLHPLHGGNVQERPGGFRTDRRRSYVRPYRALVPIADLSCLGKYGESA